MERELFRNLERKVTTEVNDKLDRNTDSPYLRVFNVDVQVEIHKLADDSKVVNLERHSYKLPETNTTLADLEKTAVTDAVRETLELTLEKCPL